jgi:cell division septum initiation protein DivIVA
MPNKGSDVNRLIDILYEQVEGAKSPALKPNMSMVDRDEMLDLLDELRAQLPIEIKRAQELLADREKFVESAKRDVERIMRQAELEAKSKVSESEILTAARRKGMDIVSNAEERSRKLYQVANEYAEDALARTEEAIQMALDEVKQSRIRFRSVSANKMQEQRRKLDNPSGAKGTASDKSEKKDSETSR